MLPKQEKIKKKPDTEQPGLFDKEDEKKRLAKKRKFVYIAMILTVGLSLSFWAYRSIKNFKMPTLNMPVSSPKTTSIKTTSNFTLPKDTNSTWSFFLKRIDTDSVIFQNNQDIIFSTQDLNSVLDKINQTDFITSSSYSSYLPQGLKIKEIVEENDSSFSYFSTITTPAQQLLLIIKITDSKDLTQAKNSIPDLINQLYWYSLQK
ncbi:MAG: hypothetical protein PHP97_03160 [Candidatus Shapirobacteria bacterium]|nr:hypothetical protein [Candidatus Shapirobacteria bacterium]MDD4383029.1 hypothetical protein [Candidatus Shapirobacteria bacterium]